MQSIQRIVMSMAAAAAMLPGAALAQDFPAKPITLIVPQNPGGTNDLVGRVVAQRLAGLLGVGVVVGQRQVDHRNHALGDQLGQLGRRAAGNRLQPFHLDRGRLHVAVATDQHADD